MRPMPVGTAMGETMQGEEDDELDEDEDVAVDDADEATEEEVEEVDDEEDEEEEESEETEDSDDEEEDEGWEDEENDDDDEEEERGEDDEELAGASVFSDVSNRLEQPGSFGQSTFLSPSLSIPSMHCGHREAKIVGREKTKKGSGRGRTSKA